MDVMWGHSLSGCGPLCADVTGVFIVLFSPYLSQSAALLGFMLLLF